MNRRQLIAACAAAAAIPAIGQSEEVKLKNGETYEDLYWQAQWQIDQLELELSEMRAHAIIMKKYAPVV